MPSEACASASEGSSSSACRAAAVASAAASAGGAMPADRADDVAVGERRPRAGKVRIDLERALCVAEAEVHAFAAIRSATSGGSSGTRGAPPG